MLNDGGLSWGRKTRGTDKPEPRGRDVTVAECWEDGSGEARMGDWRKKHGRETEVSKKRLDTSETSQK